MTSLRTVIRVWFARRRQKARHRAVEAAEREREAIVKHKAIRKEKHRAFRYLDGDLRRATCKSLAAQFGRDWAF